MKRYSVIETGETTTKRCAPFLPGNEDTIKAMAEAWNKGERYHGLASPRFFGWEPAGEVTEGPGIVEEDVEVQA